MTSRSRRTRQHEASAETPEMSGRANEFSLEHLTDEELEELLFEEEESPSGFWNLPTIAGLGLITAGVVYLFDRLGFLEGFQTAMLADMLPWLIGILIILIGFGVLSWRPKRKSRGAKVSLRDIDLDGPAKTKARQEILVKQLEERRAEERKRLRRSRYDRKIAGVCGGLAEYLNIDPTLVRIIFVVGTIASAGTFLPLYLALWFIMPKPEVLSPEERITIIRDS